MSAQPVGPFRVLNQGAQGDDARDIIRRDASNEFVFAVVGHAGSGTSMIAGTLEVRLIEENLDGSSFQACLIKVRDAIQAWATKRQKPFPVTNGKRNLRDVRTLQDYGDEMRPSRGEPASPIFRLWPAAWSG